MESITPYGAGEKSGQVEEMFDAIAPAYDFMNGAMTFGLCVHWRNRALTMADRLLGGSPRRVLDIATGTGDVAIELARRYPAAEVYGVDLSAGMLAEARRKAEKLEAGLRDRLTFEKGDSLNLTYDTDSFDMVTVAYGVRNFAHLDRGIAEMTRVLKPGGVLCIIELSEPRNRVLHAGYRLYSRTLIPFAGRMVSGDHRAYSYLPESIAAAPQREAMTALMKGAGLKNCTWKSLTLGVVTIYLGVKPE